MSPASYRLLIERIELWFDQAKQGKKVTCPLRCCEIYLQTGEGTVCSVSRSERSFTEQKIAITQAYWQAA